MTSSKSGVAKDVEGGWAKPNFPNACYIDFACDCVCEKNDVYIIEKKGNSKDDWLEQYYVTILVISCCLASLHCGALTPCEVVVLSAYLKPFSKLAHDSPIQKVVS